MALQIFGTKKCKATKKAERFFKERNILFQVIDLKEKAMSKGELESVVRAVGDEVLDKESKAYKKGGFAYMDFDIAEKLNEMPELIKTPVVRDGGKAAVGEKPDMWKEFL